MRHDRRRPSPSSSAPEPAPYEVDAARVDPRGSGPPQYPTAMASLNNPAGRLYEVLVRYQAARAENDGQALSTIWGIALGDEHLEIALSRVASIFPAISDAAEVAKASGDETLMRLVQHHSKFWVEPLLFAPLLPTSGVQGGQAVIPEASMIALESMSSILSLSRPEGREVPEEVRDSLRAELDALIGQVREDTDLDPSLKALILQRLHDIATAIDHYAVTGPGGLVAATERIIATIAIHAPKDDQTKGRLAPVVKFAGRVYTTVAFVGAAGGAAQAIAAAATALGIGS
jgi:hypothetical protein